MHTPEPWTLTDREMDYDTEVRYLKHGDRTIAEIFPCDPSGGETAAWTDEAEANALLLLAAPALRKACQSLVDAGEPNGVSDAALRDFSPSLLAAMQEARRALAKTSASETTSAGSV